MSTHSHVYHSTRWRKARQTFLQRNPLCVYCQRQGRVEAATVVDHIQPHRLGQALEGADSSAIKAAQRLFWDTSNWQALCKPCHDRHKARLERSGKASGCDEHGNPLGGGW